MSKNITQDYSRDTDIKHHIYSMLNNTKIPGIIKQIKYYSDKDYLIGLTDNMIFRIDREDYSMTANNADLFYMPRDSYEIDRLEQVNQGSMIIQNGRLTSTYLVGTTDKFGIPFSSDFYMPAIIAANPMVSPPVVITFLDEKQGVFAYQPSITSFGDNNIYKIPYPEGNNIFDPTQMEGAKSIAAGVGTNGHFRHLVKTKIGELKLYIFDGGESTPPNIIPPSPLRSFDLSNAPGINQAEFFTFVDDQQVLYYATAHKIYAVLYSSSTPIFEEKYTLPGQEEITTLQVYQQADYPQRRSGNYNSLNDKALLISTYDGQEGKVQILPTIHSGSGDIDKSNIQTFGGFDRITALGTQL